MIRRLLPPLAAAFLASCVSLEEAPMAPNPVQTGQRTFLLVFASPGPVMSETNSNIDQAAKIIPGLGLLLSATQAKRDLEASQDLQRRLPPWRPEQLFYPTLVQELSASGYPGRLAPPEEAGISETVLAGVNRADDINDWQRRYWLRMPEGSVPAHRDYSALRGAADALILELNLAYGAPSDGKHAWTPTLSLVAKLFRGADMALLWRHEETLEDKSAARAAAEFKRRPAELVERWQALMPGLARALASSLRQSLQSAGAAPRH